MKILRLHGSANDRTRVKNSLRGGEEWDIILTTCETYVAEEGWIKTHRWFYCVVDEGHKIKNSGTNLAHKIQGIGSLYRLSTCYSSSLPLPNVH